MATSFFNEKERSIQEAETASLSQEWAKIDCMDCQTLLGFCVASSPIQIPRDL